MRLFLALILFTQSVYGAAIWPNGSRLQTFQNGFLFGNGQTIDSAASGFTFGNGAQFNGPFTLQQQSTPSNPSAGFNKLYFKSDDNLYRLNSAGSELPVNGIDLGGQNQSNLTASTIKVPNRQSTSIASGQSLIETGNKNLLANPSFEHSTVSSSWTVVTGTTAAETTIIQDGLRSISLTRPTSGPTALSQSVNTSFISGQQGFMSCRVRTNQPSMRICPVVDGVTQTSICSEIAPSSSYFNYRTAFLFGASTSGLIVESTANGTGITYVDDCTLQLAQPSDFIDVAQIGPWISYTPTFTGFGTPTAVAVEYRINGSSVDIRGQWVTGTPTATEARVSLPVGFVSRAIPSIEIAGLVARNVNTSNPFSVLIEPSVSYVTFGVYSGNNPLTKQNADAIFTGGTKVSIQATIPVQGLSNKITTYSQFAVSDVSVENVFSARIDTSSGTPVIVSQSPTFIASLTDGGAGVTTINFVSGIFTVVPQINVSQQLLGVTQIITPTTSSVQIITRTGVGGAADTLFDIQVTKQGADYKAKNVITGSFQGIEKCADPYECTDTFSAKVSAAGVVSDENLDFNNGNCALTSTNLFTCTFNVGVFTVAPNCTVKAVEATGVSRQATIQSISSTTFAFRTNDAAGGQIALPTNIICQKQGVDFRPKTAVAGTFLDSVTSTSPTGRVNASVFRIGQGTKFTNCTASPCTVYPVSGIMPTSVTRSTTGTYVINYASGFSNQEIHCQGNSTNKGTRQLIFAEDITANPTTTSFTFTSRQDTGTLEDGNSQVTCWGTPP